MMVEKVFAFTQKNAVLQTPCRVLLGLSGGADSMSLLHCLLRWPQPGLTLQAVHIHHGLRGEEADRDEAFVREQCDKLRVPLTVVHVSVAEEAEAAGETIEQAGRRVRYREFQRLAEEWQADAVATAHTADDQTETVLLHMLRGSGVDGIAGIQLKRGNIIRPLLECTREEIEAFCEAEDILYIVDSTNADVTYTRNRVRHELLPILRSFNAAADEAIRRLAVHAGEDSAFLHDVAQKALAAAKTERGYAAAAVAAQPVAVRRRMLRRILSDGGCYDVTEKHLLALEQLLLQGEGAVDVPGGNRLQVSQGTLAFCAPAVPVMSPLTVTELPRDVCFGAQRFRLSLYEAKDMEHFKKVHKMFFKYAVDYDKIQGDLFVRARQEGDCIHPSGRRVGKTVKKLMNELKIPVEQRDALALLCDELGVLLIPGYCCDERVCLREGTKLFLVWEPSAE